MTNRLTYDEAIEAIKNTELIAIRNENGADQLQCPFCYSSEKVSGYAYPETWYPGHDLEHDKDCPMLRAFEPR